MDAGLVAATGDERYLDFAVKNWWRTTDYLYDPGEHLYFRDSTYFDRREANGKKLFWSRGNGWVMAGLVRMLQLLPANHPSRARFQQLFQEMAESTFLKPSKTLMVCGIQACSIRRIIPSTRRAVRVFTPTR